MAWRYGRRQGIPTAVPRLRLRLPILADHRSQTRQSGASPDSWQTRIDLLFPESASIRILAFIVVAPVGDVLRVMVEQEKVPESNGTCRDDADGSLYLDPEADPYLAVLRACNSCGYPTNQCDSDHEKTQAKDNGDAELPAQIKRRGAEHNYRYRNQ